MYRHHIPNRMATVCPAGHELKPWNARSGSCDGCHRFVRAGEQVMDCRACNWYVCEDCRPNALEQVETLWSAMSNLFFGDVCRGPPPATQLLLRRWGSAGRGAYSDRSESIDIPNAVPVIDEDEPLAHDLVQAARFGDELIESRVVEGDEEIVVDDPRLKSATPLARELTDLLDLDIEPEPVPPRDNSVRGEVEVALADLIVAPTKDVFAPAAPIAGGFAVGGA